jgi:hypothetical protein
MECPRQHCPTSSGSTVLSLQELRPLSRKEEESESTRALPMTDHSTRTLCNVALSVRLQDPTIASKAGHLPRLLGGELHDEIQTALVQAEAYQ